eukprot:9489755-Alexandrium_andersonii.AAC.1
MLDAPLVWAVPPLMLARTTAECIWSALSMFMAFGIGTAASSMLPGADVIRWLILVFSADEASSNKRFFA